MRVTVRRARAWAAMALWTVALTVAVPAAAQLPSAGSRYAGTAGTGMADARGIEASALNPANLGLNGNPRFGLQLFGASVRFGLGPVGLGDLQGAESISKETREAWLQRIAAEGSESGNAAAGVTLLAMSIGPVAVQLSTVGHADASLDPDAAELLFFGNSGRTGQPRDFAPTGSFLDAELYSTASLSYGFRIPFSPNLLNADERLSVGVTGKFTAGHWMTVLRSGDNSVTAVPLATDISLPTMESAPGAGLMDGGKGFGVDAGLAFESGPLVLSIAARNVLNTFQWDSAGLVYRANTLLLDAGGSLADFEAQAASLAPTQLRAIVDDLAFARDVAVGVGFAASDRWKLTTEFRKRLGEGMDPEPDLRVGLGTELRLVGPLTARAGVAMITGGLDAAAGTTLSFGPIRLAGAFGFRSRDGTSGTTLTASASLGGR